MSLNIDVKQQQTLQKIQLKDFIDRMCIHLNKFFPEQCDALGEEKIEEAIIYGISKADGYSVNTEKNVCKYVDLMFALGRDFDQNKELPWALKILNDRELLDDQDKKINTLYDQAMEHVKSKTE